MIQFTLIALGIGVIPLVVLSLFTPLFIRTLRKMDRLYCEKTGTSIFVDMSAENAVKNFRSDSPFGDKELDAHWREFKKSAKCFSYCVIFLLIITLLVILSILIKGILCLL